MHIKSDRYTEIKIGYSVCWAIYTNNNNNNNNNNNKKKTKKQKKLQESPFAAALQVTAASLLQPKESQAKGTAAYIDGCCMKVFHTIYIYIYTYDIITSRH